MSDLFNFSKPNFLHFIEYLSTLCLRIRLLRRVREYIIVQKKISSNETTLTKFIYGVDDITGFEIGDKLYTYKKNLQGDIIGIYDEKTQIVEYFYDAWGKCYVFDGTNYIDILIIKDYNIDSNNNLSIALKKPYLYRGYYFDIETGLYYLNSRYYDPETGKFISIDDISVLDITNIAVNGLNLYAYCLNNPVNEVDEDGYLLFTLLIAGLVGFVVSAAGSVVSQIITTGSVNGWKVLADAFFGGLSGMLTVSGLGFLGLFVTQGLLSVGNTIVDKFILAETITQYDLASSLVIGGFLGFINGKVDIKRISQIEVSMRQTLASKFRKGGLQSVFAAFKDKTRKYNQVFVLPTIYSARVDFFNFIGVDIVNTLIGNFINSHIK